MISFARTVLLLSELSLSLAIIGLPSSVRADVTPTSTPTLTPTVVVATEPTLTPTSAPPPTSLPTPPPKKTSPTREHHATATPRSSVSSRVKPTATATRKSGKQTTHHHKQLKHKRTPTPTATPVLDLNAEDTISPVTCNGSGKPVARRPFLTSPYHGWISIGSYFDHDLPDFSQDGLVITATGGLAQPDAGHQAQGFPAYWNAAERQYIYYDGHNGYDYNLDYQPVYAAAAGKVIFARYEYPDATDHGYGQMVMIDHRNGYVTLYGHFSKILVRLHQKVKRGQKIGISGNTGHSTGPHLHFTVFHNCTPTDPYGWLGSGSDPLAGYKGESSEYLWRQAPKISNPAPNWPGLSKLSAPSSERILLLRLPSVASGTDAFTRTLLREADHVRTSAESVGARGKIDMLRGAVDINGEISPSAIYSLQDVASITTPDTIEGAKEDVLAALARASLADPVKRRAVLKAKGWVGYLLHWEGQALLLGRGLKGQQVRLRLTGGRGGAARRIEADPVTGSYALDLGHLTRRQFTQLRSELLGTRAHGRKLQLQPVRTEEAASRSSNGPPYAALLLALLALLATAAAAIWRLRLRHVPAAPEGPPPPDAAA